MEPFRGVLAVFCAVSLLVTTAVITMYATKNYGCFSPRIDVSMPDDSMEYLDRFHNSEKRVTAILGVAANKCYILTNDQEPDEVNRALRIVPEQLSEEVLRAIGGENVVEFCQGLHAVPVEIIGEEQLRAKRQAAGRGRLDREQVRRTQNRLSRNQCQNEVLVDCGGQGGVYECLTGPAEVYRAKTQCNSATQFSFNLETRCKEFPKTQKHRFIKCLQAFIYGTNE